LKQEKIESVMEKPFPFVAAQSKLEEISRAINKDNDAVLVRDMLGTVHIITKYDVIEAIG
jgi:cystathionine beta-synthase